MPQQASISTSLTPLHLNCIKFGSVLLRTRCEFVMTRLKGRKCSTLGSSPNAHLVLLNQEWISHIVLRDYWLKCFVVGLSAKSTVWGKEIKRCLSWMHLDFLITQHLCEAKSYLHSFQSTDMNDEFSLNHCILYTSGNEISWKQRCLIYKRTKVTILEC